MQGGPKGVLTSNSDRFENQRHVKNSFSTKIISDIAPVVINLLKMIQNMAQIAPESI